MSALLLSEVAGSVRNLPSLPALVLELISQIEQPRTDVAALARKVALDQALAARTLRLANSSFYGMQEQISTIAEAIAVIGLQNVHNLALTAALMSNLAPRGPNRFDFRAFWRHAIAAALAARALARPVLVNPETAYAAGLLHDIGQLVLATRFPDHYAHAMAQRANRDLPLVEAERQTLFLDHALVGEALVRHWRFPETIQLAVAQHHALEDAQRATLSHIIHAADAVAHALDLSGDAHEVVPVVEPRTWQLLHMDAAALQPVFAEVEREFETASGVMEPDLHAARAAPGPASR